MIPENIRLLLHNIRLIGGGMREYENADDWCFPSLACKQAIAV